MKGKTRLTIAGFGALLLSGFSDPAPPDISGQSSHWLFVHEIIVDQPPDYRSDLFFADQASIKQGDDNFTLSISHIILTETAGSRGLRDQILDKRSQMEIDCRKRTFRFKQTKQYDGEENLIPPVSPVEKKLHWEQASSDAGAAEIVSLVCEGDSKIAEQRFPGHVQPLKALLAYLNADWSK